MPGYTLGQIDAELAAAQKRRAADLDLISRALLDITAMDDRIDEFLKARIKLDPRHKASTG